MEYTVVVGSYDIIKVSQNKLQNVFSRDVQTLLDQGWQLKGELHSSTAVLKRQGMLHIYVTLVQNMVRVNAAKGHLESLQEG